MAYVNDFIQSYFNMIFHNSMDFNSLCGLNNFEFLNVVSKIIKLSLAINSHHIFIFIECNNILLKLRLSDLHNFACISMILSYLQ